MPIINGVIGHEKHRQEFFGRYSSGSKSAIYALADVFEAIANDLGLNDIKAKFQKIDKLLHLLPEQSSKPDETLDEKSSKKTCILYEIYIIWNMRIYAGFKVSELV